MYRDFGVEVTVVEVLGRIVPGEDPEVSAVLKKCFEERAVRVLTNAKADPKSLRKTDHGVTIEVYTEDGAEVLSAEVLLVAVGRRTVTEGLNLETTGVETNARARSWWTNTTALPSPEFTRRAT
jgi:pyruvate/2-oxoglutarate dehydrogenase complex dihydrolipoamide dehydrogenase (E3) component